MADSKTTKSVEKAIHPKYSEMIATALETLKEKGGSSRVAIINFITSKYKVSDNPNVVNSRLKVALKKGVESGALTQVKGTGASGSFKLDKKAAQKPKKAIKSSKAAKSPQKAKAKSVAVKKPKAVKSPKKATKSPKKPKAGKSPKTATKPKPKKAAKLPAKATKPKAAVKKTTQKAAKPKVKKPTKK